MLQSHINLTADDKIFLAANYLKPDPNQGIYEYEYERKLDRIVAAARYTSNGMFTLSGVSNVAKNAFIGFEAAFNVSKYIIVYNTIELYNIYLLTIFTYLPKFSQDPIYNIVTLSNGNQLRSSNLLPHTSDMLSTSHLMHYIL